MTDIVYSSTRQGLARRIVPDLVRDRGLLWDFVSRQLRARYRNAMMGFLWAILQPLLLTLILTFVFTILFQMGGRANVRQTAVEILGKLIFWQFLAAGMLTGVQSLIEHQNLIKKTSFSREVLPIAAVINCAVNLLIGFVVLVCVHLALIGALHGSVLFVPVVFTGQLALVLGLTLLVSSLNVRYRDVGYLLDVALTFGFYASPVLYPLEWVRLTLGEESLVFRLYCVNPMVGYLETYRCALSGVPLCAPGPLLWSVVCSATALAGGAVVFRRLSPTFADYL